MVLPLEPLLAIARDFLPAHRTARRNRRRRWTSPASDGCWAMRTAIGAELARAGADRVAVRRRKSARGCSCVPVRACRCQAPILTRRWRTGSQRAAAPVLKQWSPSRTSIADSRTFRCSTSCAAGVCGRWASLPRCRRGRSLRSARSAWSSHCSARPRHRCAPARPRPWRAAVRRVAGARVADRVARAAVVRVCAAARSVVGCARARRSRRGRHSPGFAADGSHDTHSRLLQLPVAMRDPRILRTLLLLDLESHPPVRCRRHRRDRSGSGAGAHRPVLTARACLAVCRNVGDADRPPRCARRHGPMRRPVARRFISVRWVRDEPVRNVCTPVFFTQSAWGPTSAFAELRRTRRKPGRRRAQALSLAGSAFLNRPPSARWGPRFPPAARSVRRRFLQFPSSPVLQLPPPSRAALPPSPRLRRTAVALAEAGRRDLAKACRSQWTRQATRAVETLSSAGCDSRDLGARPSRAGRDRSPGDAGWRRDAGRGTVAHVRSVVGGKALESRRVGRHVSDGAACRLFRDRQSGVWFLEGVFD